MEKSLGLKSYSVFPSQFHCCTIHTRVSFILGKEVGASLHEVLKSLKIKLKNSSNGEILKD